MARLTHDNGNKASMSGVSGLLGLPQEMIDAITAECDKEDLPSLRLTCKILSTAATKPFAEKCFVELRFVFSEYSLQGLVDISAHPVFGRCVKTIGFSINRLGEYLFLDWTQRYAEFNWQETHLIRLGRHVSLMKQAFLNLKRLHDTKIVLGIYDYGTFGRKGFGISKSYGPKNHTYERTHVAGETLTAMMKACVEAGLTIQGLDIDCLDASRKRELFSTGLDSVLKRHALTGTGTARPGLELTMHLSRSFRNGKHNKGRIDDTTQDARVKIQQFNKTSSKLTLTHHCINGWAWSSRQTVELLVRNHGFCICKTLRRTPFTNIVIKHSDICLFSLQELLYSKTSLKHLTLIDVDFWADGMAQTSFPVEVLKYFKDNFKLESIVLKDLTGRDVSHNQLEIVGAEEVGFFGRQEVEEGLSVMICGLEEAVIDIGYDL